MSSQTIGIQQQDRTLNDLLETWRHLQSDPNIPDERKARAADRMKGVWENLAKLQDSEWFAAHLAEYIHEQYEARHNPEANPDLEPRTKPLCRCDLSKHVCEVKMGEVPSKVKTQDLTYLESSTTRELARSYVEDHTGDVVVGEAISEFRSLRAEIYAEMNDIIVMLRSGMTAESTADVEGADAPRERPALQPDGNHSVGREADDDPRASADGGDMTNGTGEGGDGGGG